MGLTFWLEELTADALHHVGKKCANLGEMTREGLPVPPGFAISLEAYNTFFDETGLRGRIRELIGASGLLTDNINDLEKLSRAVREMVESCALPSSIRDEIVEKYRGLGERIGRKDPEVAVRSSGAVSMPGSYETHLWVAGEGALLTKVRRVWSSSFNARTFAYKQQKGMSIEDSAIGVGVIKMVKAKAAGVLFTINPLTGDRAKMVIEANYGLGESVVSGRIAPDRFRVNRITGAIEERVLGAKEEECLHASESGGIVFLPVCEERRDQYCVSDEELGRLIALGKKVESVFGKKPQDIEWAFDEDLHAPDDLLLLQARPEQTYAAKMKEKAEKAKTSDGMKYISSFLVKGIKIE